MTRFLEIKNFLGLIKVYKKRTHHKTKPKQRKTKKTQNLFSFSLSTFVLLLSIDASVAVVIIHPPLLQKVVVFICPTMLRKSRNFRRPKPSLPLVFLFLSSSFF